MLVPSKIWTNILLPIRSTSNRCIYHKSTWRRPAVRDEAKAGRLVHAGSYASLPAGAAKGGCPGDVPHDYSGGDFYAALCPAGGAEQYRTVPDTSWRRWIMFWRCITTRYVWRERTT